MPQSATAPEAPDLASFVMGAAAAAAGTEPQVRTNASPLHNMAEQVAAKEYQVLTKRSIKGLLEAHAPPDVAARWLDFYTPATVLPMRTNNYVVEELIRWEDAPTDPIFQLVVPQPEMLDEESTAHMRALIESGEGKGVRLQDEANSIRAKLNPHPAGQKTLNVPKVSGEALPGLQHKYPETALHFATEAQYCHAYCTYCFRWAQFVSVGSPLQFANKDAELLAQYLAKNKVISDLLLTGGDPMVMTAEQMGRYIRPILNSAEHDHVQTIRIGTKSLAYWPYRFVTDADADPMLRLLEDAVKAGKHVSIMAHFTHPAELGTPVVREAIRRIRNTGAQIRTQAPLVGHVNDDAAAWARMWKEQVRLGCVPYYFFVSRDTGPREYFNVPLVKAYDIFTEAFTQQSGLARTVRGPSMSCDPGKVHYIGPADVNGEKVMVFKFLQARNPAWAEKPFFAAYDDKAVWLDDLKPAFGAEKFFFEDEFAEIVRKGASSGQLYQSPADEG
ncbi:hypothetical protein FNF31_01288 [Cafeteria roenbergensis]|uniref:Radical SAM core domain-containing protein n=1 Tax=Cafeteria roenbergensis TaxID=33653 RepID=A0A5A8DRP7_CAFRO|nr:hypothetical protein FNF31_01288 [Cafeteria roenbergensis]